MTSYLELPDDGWELEHERFQRSEAYEAALFEWEEDTVSMSKLRRHMSQSPAEREAEFQASNDYADSFERWHEDRLRP
jgi:hypothetical protein